MTFRNYITQFVGVIFLMVGLFQLGLAVNAAQADTLTVTNNLNVVGFDDSKESLYMCVDDGPAPFGDLGKIEQGETVQLSGDFTTNAENRRFYFVWRTDDSNSFNTYCDSLNSFTSQVSSVANFPLSEIKNSNIEINGELGVLGEPWTYKSIVNFGMFVSTIGQSSINLVPDFSGEFEVTQLCIDGIYRVEEESGSGVFIVTPGEHEVFVPVEAGIPGELCPINDFKLSWIEKLTGSLSAEAQIVQNPVSVIAAEQDRATSIFFSDELNSNFDFSDAIDDVRVFSNGELIWEYTSGIGGGVSLLRTGGLNSTQGILYTLGLITVLVTSLVTLLKVSK